jgi:hypothetical protein
MLHSHSSNLLSYGLGKMVSYLGLETEMDVREGKIRGQVL